MLNTLARWLGYTKATDPRAWTQAAMRMGGGNRGEPPPFNYDAAVQHYASWVFAAATINANAVASLPLRLYIRAGKGSRQKLFTTRPVTRSRKAYLLGDGRQTPSLSVLRKAAEIGSDFEEVVDAHPILTLLARSNPFINGYDACVLRVVWQELCGNAYLHVVTGKLGTPAQLWPMPPQWVRILPDEQQFIAGYLYGRNTAQEVEFKPDEVIHFRRPNPRDLWYGMGKLEAAWGAASANVAVHAMDLSTFKNNARPDYLLSVKGQASEDELDALEERIKTKFKGPTRGGHFLVSSSDIDLKPLSFPPKDIVGREDIVEEIAACFGVPVTMLKANDPNLASARQGFQSWREMTVLPLARMDEEVLNQRLLPMFDLGSDDAVLAYDNPVAADEQLELTRRQSAVSSGWMTPNEARMEQGLEPLDDPHADMLHVGGMPLGGPAGGPGIGGPGLPLSGLGAGEALPALPAGAPASPPALPAPEDEETPVAEVAAGEPVANTALNGAQISSLVNLAGSARSGELPADSAKAIAIAAFPGISEAAIAAIFDPIVAAGPVAAAPAEAAPAEQKSDDCVSRKVRTLLAEGYEQEQAVAIAISMCEDEAGRRTKAIEDIDTVPPKGVQANARRALKVRESKPESQRGMTAVGIARARDLANGAALSERTIRRMLAYFDRHQSDKKGETWDEQGKGWQAWNGWGGDAGWSWARRKVEEFDRARDRKGKSLDAVCEECGDDLATAGYAFCSDCLPIVAPSGSITKDCGTGAGGFKPGNTCGEEDGGGSDDDEDDDGGGSGGKDDGGKDDVQDEVDAATESDIEVDDSDESEAGSADEMFAAVMGQGPEARKAQLAIVQREGISQNSQLQESTLELAEEGFFEDGFADLTLTGTSDPGLMESLVKDEGDTRADPQFQRDCIVDTIGWATDLDEKLRPSYGGLGDSPRDAIITMQMNGEARPEQASIAMYAGNVHYRWMNRALREGTDAMSAIDAEFGGKAGYGGKGGEGAEIDLPNVSKLLTSMARAYVDDYDANDGDIEIPTIKDWRGKELPADEALRKLDGEMRKLQKQIDANPSDREKLTARWRPRVAQVVNAVADSAMADLRMSASQQLLPDSAPPIRVTRGLNVDNAAAEVLFESIDTAKTIRMDGMISASLDDEVSRAFAANQLPNRRTRPRSVMFTISTRHGLPTNPAEAEIILPPGDFKVTGVRTVRNGATETKFVELEALRPKPAEEDGDA